MVDALWETEYISTLRMRATATPDENGEFLLAVEESLFAATLRDSYPTWEGAKEDVTKDWEEFLACIPHFNEELEEMREEAAYILWSAFVNPCGRVKRRSFLGLDIFRNVMHNIVVTACGSVW